MKVELVIEKKEFAKDGAEKIVYFDYTAVIDGQSIHLQPKENDKKLATYLLNNHFVKETK